MEDQELVRSGPIFVLGADPDPFGCLPPHSGHIQMVEKPHLVGNPGEGFHPVEGDITCGQCFPQIGTLGGSPHGPHQGFRSIGMKIQPGGRPFRQGPATIGGSDLTPVQIFEYIELNTMKPADLGLGVDEHPLLLILGQQL